MLEVRLKLRNVVAIAICLAVTTMFSGCDDNEPETFTYTASAGSGGTINPEGSVLISQGESLTFTATPDNGKIVNEWSVNGTVVATSGNSYTLTNVQSNGTIQVTFKDYIVWQLTATMTAALDDKGVLTISTTKETEDMPYTQQFWTKDEISYRDRILSVVIEDRVTTIGYGAFFNCIKLISVTIPNSIRTIGNVAFYGCSALTSITIPNSVTSIENTAFSGCYALTSITIPSSVTTIGLTIFYECSNLKNIKVEWNTPIFLSSGGNLFNLVSYFSAATLHVPTGTKTLYQADPVWSLFGTIVEY